MYTYSHLLDYTLSASTVFTNVARLQVEQGNALQVLQASIGCCLDEWEVADALASQLPSWVPDLRTLIRRIPDLTADSDCSFMVRAETLLCHWYFLGVCHTRPLISAVCRDMDLSANLSMLDSIQKRSLSLRSDVRSRHRDESPSAGDVTLCWPNDNQRGDNIDADLAASPDMPQVGDVLCAVTSPIWKQESIPNEHHVHGLRAYILQAASSFGSTYKIVGRCRVMYRSDTPKQYHLRTFQLV